MVAELRAAGFEVARAHLEITGDLPRGSGLSSSAALEAALALRAASAATPRRPEASWRSSARGSRTTGSGAETGLLDQFASLLLARPGTCCGSTSAASTSSRTRSTSATGSSSRSTPARRTSIAASGYNQRRAECRAACEALGIDSLRDATTSSALDGILLKRARHVVSENARVDATAAALDAHDLRDRRASCSTPRTPRCATTTRRPCPRSRPPCERLKAAGAAGARMVGGGFGGSVLALLPARRRPAAHGALAVAPRRSPLACSRLGAAPRPAGA